MMPAWRLMVAAVVLCTAATALTAVTASSAVSGGSASRAGGGSAGADAVPGGRARPVVRRVVALTANIHGGHDRAGRPNPEPWAAVRRAMAPRRRGGPPARLVLVNEVCTSQVEYMRRTYRSWEFLFFPENRSAETTCPGNAASGNVIGSLHDLHGATRALLPHDPTCGDANAFNDLEVCDVRFGLDCAYVDWGGRSGRAIRACVTHLIPGWSSRRRYTVRAAQTDRIRALLAPSLRAGVAVVLGGDFNTVPGHEAMDAIYDLRRTGGPGGRGAFDEVDQVDSGASRRGFPGRRPRHHRTYTHHAFRGFGDRRSVARDKFDYLFFSRNSVDGSARAEQPLHGRVLRNRHSDHDVLLGVATVSALR